MTRIKLNGTFYTLNINLYSFYHTTSELSITTPKLLERLSDLDFDAYLCFIYHSLNQYNQVIEKEELLDIDLEEFIKLIEKVNIELSKAMPQNKGNDNNNNSVSNNNYDEEDWNYDYLQYIWNTLLNRSGDYLKETPKNILGQFDIYKKINGIEEVESSNNKSNNNEIEYKYIDQIF